jgi:LPXTG-site transpeptidase (sortase) family protein
MDIIPPKKASATASDQRNPAQYRRACLDTYAKNRVHIDTTGRTQAKTQSLTQQPTPQIVQQPGYAPQSAAVLIDELSDQDMAALWAPVHNPLQSQAVKPVAVNDTVVSAAPKLQKKNRLTDLKASLKNTQNIKKQERELQKQQKAELKRAATEQSNEPSYIPSIAQYAAPVADDTRSKAQYANDEQSLLDESGGFSVSQARDDQEKKVEANLRALYARPLTEQIAASSENSASASHMRTIIASAFACGIMAVGIFTVFGNYGSQPVIAQPIGSPVIEVEASTPQPQAGAPVATPSKQGSDIIPADPSHPVRIIMSSIGVNAPVQGLGTTPEGLMAVPKSYGIVGWYNKGAVPGKPGPAVLAGHYTGGNKGVFDKLQDAKDGDLITVANGRGQTFTYKVTAKNEYDKDKVPMAELFKNSVDSRLEIITCSGKWQTSQYDKRLVVTAEIVR